MKKQRSELTRTHEIVRDRKGPVGPSSAGQAGDLQGLSDVESADSESVQELLEEGQSFEAEAVRAIENAPDADVAEVHTKQVPEDDVPAEYLERADKTVVHDAVASERLPYAEARRTTPPTSAAKILTKQSQKSTEKQSLRSS